MSLLNRIRMYLTMRSANREQCNQAEKLAAVQRLLAHWEPIK